MLPDIANKVKQILSNLYQKVKQFYAKLKPQSREARTVLEMKDALSEMQDLFVEGINAATQNLRNMKNTATEGDVKFMARETIKNQINGSLDTLREMDPVKQISEKTIAELYYSDKTTRMQKIEGIIRNYKKGVSTQNFGTIKLDENSVADILSHGSTFERYAVFEAVPQVLKHVKKVADYNDNSKSTITVAAPIMFGTHRINVGVLVSQNNNKVYGYYFTDENGNKFQYEKGAIPTLYATSFDKSNETTINGIALINNISQSEQNINTSTQKSQSRDVDYLSAVENGDMTLKDFKDKMFGKINIIKQGSAEHSKFIAKNNSYIE